MKKEFELLVLSRYTGQTIQIDGGIEIEVLEISGNQVRLGIRAPKETLVLRGELEKLETKAIEVRNEAEDAADKLASLILGEPADWSDHQDAWNRSVKRSLAEKQETSNGGDDRGTTNHNV